MLEVSCPKCAQVYPVDVAAIGQECECEACGKIFVAELRPAGNIAQKLTLPEPDTAITAEPPKQEPPRKAPVLFTAIFFRTIAWALVAVGALLIISGLLLGLLLKILPIGMALSILGFIKALCVFGCANFFIASIPFFVASVPFFAIAQILTFLGEIAHNTYDIRRRLPPRAGTDQEED